MGMKNPILLIVLFTLYSLPIFSQNTSSVKKVFVYKTVKGHNIKANIFLPDSKKRCPVLIYFHGGGFIFGNRDRGLNIYLKEKLLANNYAIVSADYRLAPETKLEEILKDVGDVVGWIREKGSDKFNVDPDKIAVAGGSAGGYLSLSTGFNKTDSPNAIIAISSPTGFSPTNIEMGDLSILDQPGPYDIVTDSLVSYGDYSSRMSLWRFLARNRLALYEIFGFDPSKEPEKLEKFKLTNCIKTIYPPTLLVHAKNDHLVDIKQAHEFLNYLNNKSIDCELFIVENGHSTELINQHPEAVDRIISFLNEQFQ
jgi:acetyl esterase/lipase